MTVSNRLKNQHLLWRAAFGPMAEHSPELDALSQKKLWDLLVKTSAKKPGYIDVANDAIKGVIMGIQNEVKAEALSKDQKQMLRQQSREDLKSLNLRWLDEMINSEAQLREKMAFFWHGHFACRDINIFFQQLLLHEIRNNALGNFRDLLNAVSKSASMLAFLNNQQNRKQHPNENFAREVMELFTLGRGNYTENDIKEAARAFTGWSFNIRGEFVFRKNQHDSGSKTIFGKTGNFGGEDVLNMLLDNKLTAKYICKKIYRFFVNENQPDEAKINWLADRFYQSGYEILPLMQDIFTADWFYAEKNIGSKIKSPVELMAGMRRMLPMELQTGQVQLLFQRVLGQVLFYPPNVAGWPGGKNWIDSSSLMFRLRMPQLLRDNEALNISAKSDDDQQMGMMEMESPKKEKIKPFRKNAGGGAMILADIDWEAYSRVFTDVPREQLTDVVATVLLQTPDGAIRKEAIMLAADQDSRDAFIRTVTIAVMATPEYQLC